MTAADKIKLTIDDKAHSYARIYASLLASEFQRKRAYSSIAALYALINILEETDFDIQKSMTLFRNPVLNEQYEISDLYVNNWHIDVRIITDGNAFLVPKCHFDNDIVPDFYAVIKADTKLQSAELIGFAETKNLKKEGFNYLYFSCPNSQLIDYKEFLNKIAEKKPENFSEEDHNLFRENYLSLIDNEIDNATKNKILKHLFNCNECRTEFCCFTGFEMVSCNVSNYPDLLNDETLNIIGAQAVNDRKYDGKEEIIQIKDDEENIEADIDWDEAPEQKENDTEKEETVSDILDELFNIEEETIKPDMSSDKEINTQVVSDDLEILNDFNSTDELINIEETNDEVELIIDSNNDTDIENTNQTINESSEELQLIEDNNPSFEINDNEYDSPEIIEEEPTIVPDNEAENVQKVIVDYDETGEPIYSYITNISNNDENTNETFSEIETIDDNNYGDTNETSENIENNSDIEFYDDKEVQDNDILEFEDDDDNLTTNNSVDTEQEVFEPIDYQTTEEDSTFNEDSESSDIESQQQQDDNQIKNTEEPEEDSEEYEYEDDGDFDIENSGKHQGGSKKGLIVAIFAIIFLAASGGALFFMKNINAANNTTANSGEIQTEIPEATSGDDMFEQPAEQDINAENQNIQQNDIPQQPQQENPIEIPTTGSIEIPVSEDTQQPAQLTEKDLLAQSKPTGNVNKVMSNAFNGQNSVILRGINWQCAPSLFTNRKFKTYLQNLDNVLKLNIKKNLLDTSDIPQNNSLTVKMAIDNDGNLVKSIISDSSGSEQIDNIVLQSINQTLESQKAQILSDSELKADKYYLQVVIKL